MNNPCLLIPFLGAALLFGLSSLRILLTLMALLAALASGAVKWPGPSIHSPNPEASLGRIHFGRSAEHLFPAFVGYGLGVIGAFVFFLLMLLSSTSLFAEYIQLKWSWETPLLMIAVFFGGLMGATRVIDYIAQVNMLLSDLSTGAEPRHIDGQSAEAEYAIEHPLAGYYAPKTDADRALALFCEATTCVQSGNTRASLLLYQEAMSIDPALHEYACEALSNLSQGCSPKEAGPIYYWLGAHSEYLMAWKQAQTWYEKAIIAFSQIGYQKREARAHCNLGNVKMHRRDESAMEEFEKAVALNPRNGTAYLNMGRTYYGLGEPGDGFHELALDAFVGAILADPPTYGPMVISSLRELGYTWEKDLEEITRRVESKRH